MSKTVEQQIQDILNEYVKEVQEVTERDLKKAATDTAKQLRSTSPKEHGDYAKSWTYKKNENGGYIVYNKKYGWKTHLLENGHMIRNRRRGPSLGRVNGIKHIEPAAEQGADKLIKDLKIDLQRI